MSNKVTLVYNLCEKPPENGYSVLYRPINSTIEYRRWPVNFFATPAVLNITEDEDGTLYEGFIRSEYADGRACTPVFWRIEANCVWEEDTFVCEQDNPFSLSKSVTGFASPSFTYFDQPSGHVYVLDHDDALGNFFYFDPATLNTKADATFIPNAGGARHFMYSGFFDAVYRRGYACGNNGGGLKVLDMATNTLSVVNYGTDTAYSRLLLRVLGDNIYVNNTQSTPKTFTIISRAALTVLSTTDIAAMPSGNSYFLGGPEMQKVGDEIWVVVSQATGSSSVGRFNADLTTLIGTIDISAYSATWDNAFWWRSSYYDEEKGRYYVYDMGSNTLIVIDSTTRAVVYTKQITNRQGKTHSSMYIVKDSLTGELYLSGTMLNTTTDTSPFKRTYRINRDNYTFEYLYPDDQFISLVSITGTSSFVGASPGIVAWISDTTATRTDGIVSFYTK